MKNKKRSDLSAYKKPTAVTAVLVEPKSTPQKEAVLKPSKRASKKIVGRPKKDPKERRDHKLTINMTKAEKDILIEKSGMVPEATFVLDVLRKNGLFDKLN